MVNGGAPPARRSDLDGVRGLAIAHATGNWDVPAWLGRVVIGLSFLLADATHS